MKKMLTLAAIAMPIFALQTETIHSSVSSYYEAKNYQNSLQKKSANVYGFGADIHLTHHQFKGVYEYTHAATKQPPLTKDLYNQKIFLRYGYHINNSTNIALKYIHIIKDNIAITSGGYSLGAEVSYTPLLHLQLHATQYKTFYDAFDVYQSDIRLDYATKFYGIHTTLSSINKYITLHDTIPNSFTKNAHKEYFTSGIKLHLHYKGYHFGGGAYFGKRAFAIMNDGFKIQHHAMEIHTNYALGIGKSFLKRYIVRVQYIYSNAKELPMEHNDVSVKNIRFLLNYKI